MPQCSKGTCKREATPGYKQCEYHRAMAARGQLLRRQRRKQYGLCTTPNCQNKPREGVEKCEPCLAKNRAMQKRLNEKRAQVGGCARCGVQLTRPGGLCSYCKEYERDRQHNLRERARADFYNWLLPHGWIVVWDGGEARYEFEQEAHAARIDHAPDAEVIAG